MSIQHTEILTDFNNFSASKQDRMSHYLNMGLK
jgi:hypothetical protein